MTRAIGTAEDSTFGAFGVLKDGIPGGIPLAGIGRPWIDVVGLTEVDLSLLLPFPAAGEAEVETPLPRPLPLTPGLLEVLRPRTGEDEAVVPRPLPEPLSFGLGAV